MPYLYAIPYLQLAPSYVYVLDTPPGGGGVVGYVLGVPSTAAFVEAYNTQYVGSVSLPTVSNAADDSAAGQVAETIAAAKNSDRMLLPGIMEQFPAHLHVDILDGHTGKGWGTALVRALLDQLASESVAGIHLGMAEDNVRAGRFYRRLGFSDVSEQAGEKGHGARWFARKL